MKRTNVWLVVVLVALACMPYGQTVSAKGRPEIVLAVGSIHAPALPQSSAGLRALVPARNLPARTQLAQSNASLIHDYGAFSLWRVEAADLPALRRLGATLSDSFDAIFLRSAAIDTRNGGAGTGEPQVPAALRQTRAKPAQFWLVQFAGPTADEWLKQVTDTGAKIVTYMPNHAYVVWADGDALARLDALAAASPVIHWTGAYHPAYRLAPSLQLLALDSAGDAKSEQIDVSVQFYRTAEIEQSLERLLKLGGAVLKNRSDLLVYTNIALQLPAQNLAEVARWPDVFNIAPWAAPRLLDEAQGQILAGNLTLSGTAMVPTGPGYLAWLASKGFPVTPASYPLVDIVDDGVDQGNAAAVLHPDFYEVGSTANPDRVIYIQNCTTDPTGNGVGGHGNINAGIVGGFSNRTGWPYVDAMGYRLGLGIAPYGPIAGTKIFANSGFYDVANCDNTDEGVVLASYLAGARITSNSWGADTFGAYDVSAQAYDALTRDANDNLADGNQQMLHIFAAGNAGPGASTVGSPGTAKNVITVGATENVRDDGIYDGCGDPNANNADDIAGFSSRGPTGDQRVKPDLVAPGTHVQGPASKDPGFDGSGVCGSSSNNFAAPPDDAYYPPAQITYTWSSGTSHSTPAVAGASALVWEYYKRALNPGVGDPSPAMLKAILVNASRYLSGTGTGGTLPSNNQGWGDVNLGRVFDGTPRRFVDQSQVFAATGEEYFLTGHIVDPGKPFQVSLVWTDAPGPLSGNAYVNDLNLEVSTGGNTYLGNVFSGDHSVAGGTADPRNNVESVFLPAGLTGSYTVRVVAANVAGDGIPGNGDATDQDFALVIDNSDNDLALIMGVVTDTVLAQPIAGAEVVATRSMTEAFAAGTTLSGTYELRVSSGQYTLTAAAYGYWPSGVITTLRVISGTTTTVDIGLAPAPFYAIDGVVTSNVTGLPLSATVTIAGEPFDPPVRSLSTDPGTGYYSVTLAAGQAYTLSVSALFHAPAITRVAELTGDITADFVLSATTINGGVYGRVLDDYSSVPISTATVSLAPGTFSSTTDGEGQFQILDAPPGVYTATASAPLFGAVSITQVEVITSNLVSRTFRLPRGVLNYAPAALEKTLTFGDAVTDSAGLILGNPGALTLAYTLTEMVLESSMYSQHTSGEAGAPVYNFVDISGTGTALSLTDDSEANVTLPFSFPYYGGASSQLRVGNNGALLVASTAGDVPSNNTSLTVTAGTNHLIAPFWDDLDAQAGNVYWQVEGAAPERRAIVQWQDRPHFTGIGPVGAVTFQVVLYEDGDILFQYADVTFGSSFYDGGASASVGIRGPDAAGAEQFSFDQAGLSDGVAICFDYAANLSRCGVSQPGGALSWLNVSPRAGLALPSATHDIAIGWAATPEAGIAQPGTYHGLLALNTTDPFARRTVIPVTLTVAPAASQVRIMGVISSSGVCDMTPAPLAGAAVVVESATGYSQMLTTGSDGVYDHYLLDGGTYTLTASATQHVSQVVALNLTAGMTYTQDFTLRLIAPCLQVEPASLSAAVELGQRVTREITVTSRGPLALDFAIQELPITATAGGPDASGYVFIARRSFDFTDISGTGTPANPSDDGEVSAVSPFTLTFYDQSSQHLRISNNGAILFGASSGDVDFNNIPVTATDAPAYFIAPFWDDLSSQTGSIYTQTAGSAPNRKFVVQWHNRPHYDGVGAATFQAIFHEDGNIVFNYLDVQFGNPSYDAGAGATVGIRGPDAAHALQYAHDTARLSDGLSICFQHPLGAPCANAAWLAETPARVVDMPGIPPTSQVVTVTFDASAVPTPGVYAATLLVSNNSPTPAITIPVVMTVTGEPFVAVSADPPVIVADGASTSTIVVTVWDSDGAPISGAPLTLVASQGTLAATSGSTEPSGRFTTTLVASHTPGAAMVGAVADGIGSGQTYVTFTSPGAVLTGTYEATPAVVQTGAAVTFTFVVSNMGAGRTDNLVMAAAVPEGVTVNGVTGGVLAGALSRSLRLAHAPAGAVVVWTGALDSGVSHTLLFSATVTAVTGRLDSTASVWGGPGLALQFSQPESVSVEPSARLFLPILTR